MITEIKIKKGQEANKLLLIRELAKDINDLFESIKNEDAKGMEKFFGAGHKIVATKNFTAKLIIEIDD